MILFPNVSALTWLTEIIAIGDIYIHLYVRDVILDLDTVKADLQESSAPGYVAQEAIGWSTPDILTRRAFSEAIQLDFTRSGGDPQEDVYGLFATRGVNGELLWVERGEAPPYPYRIATDHVPVTPRIFLRSMPIKKPMGL